MDAEFKELWCGVYISWAMKVLWLSNSGFLIVFSGRLAVALPPRTALSAVSPNGL